MRLETRNTKLFFFQNVKGSRMLQDTDEGAYLFMYLSHQLLPPVVHISGKLDWKQSQFSRQAFRCWDALEPQHQTPVPVAVTFGMMVDSIQSVCIFQEYNTSSLTMVDKHIYQKNLPIYNKQEIYTISSMNSRCNLVFQFSNY